MARSSTACISSCGCRTSHAPGARINTRPTMLRLPALSATSGTLAEIPGSPRRLTEESQVEFFSMFTGIIAGVGRISRIESAKGGLRLAIDAGELGLGDLKVGDSVAVNGVSLTVNAARGAEFEVNLIPHTLAATTLRHLEVGDRVNLEVDPLARYAERLLRRT